MPIKFDWEAMATEENRINRSAEQAWRGLFPEEVEEDQE